MVCNKTVSMRLWKHIPSGCLQWLLCSFAHRGCVNNAYSVAFQSLSGVWKQCLSPNKLTCPLGFTHGLVAGPLCSSPCSLWLPEDSCSSGKPFRCGEVWTVIPEDALRGFRGDIVMTKVCISFRYVCVSKARYFLDWGDGREATWIQIPVYVICWESEIQHLCSLYACVSKTAGLSPSCSPPQPVFLPR